MPLIGFTCPPSSPTHGQRQHVDFCLSKCPHPCVAPPLLLAIHEAELQNHHKGAYISSSMLSGSSCARQTKYEREVEFYEHPQRRYWSFRGTHAHSIIERGAERLLEYGWLQEMRMTVPLVYPDLPMPILDENGVFTGKYDDTQPLTITLGGTLDAYNPMLRDLVDFKSMADVKAEMFVKGKGDKGTFHPHFEDKWIWQLNIYAWLLGQTEMPEDVKKRYKLKGKRFPYPKRLIIQGISMMSIPRSGASAEVKVGKYDKQIMEVPEIPVLPAKAVEAFVREQALKWFKWLVLGEMPPVVGEDKKWMCKNCPFNGELIDGERCFPTQERKLGVIVDDLDEA